MPETLSSGNHSVWSYLTSRQLANQNFVLLGAPGSGKTTLLKHIALTLINRRQRRTLPREIQRAYRLPFLLFLRQHRKSIQADPDYPLVDALEMQLKKWDRAIPNGWIRHQLRRGKCLILLDGLDEVADEQARTCVVAWVEKQIQLYSENRFIVTSRPFGYRSNPMGE